MVFSSFTFIFTFLPITLILYYISPRRVKNMILLISSLVFYAWGELIYIGLMVLSILFNYFCGKDIYLKMCQNENDSSGHLSVDGNQKKQKNMGVRISFVIAIIVNLLILGFFKYYGFLIDTINTVAKTKIEYRQLGLPVGISFYTFQAISYLIDVYRGEVTAQKNIINFALYIAMFPQLIAGPIVRYIDIEIQLKWREESLQKFGEGTRYFIVGLGKKVILANSMGKIFESVSQNFSSGIKMSIMMMWVGAIAYTLQIYFDFSGYSDMAVGLGKMFGFDLKKNFDYPYISKSVTEFWRRWHISLGTWFREYIYIPLGGNRVSAKKHIRNLLIVWMLTGLWHGAQWNFVIWGLYYGVLLIFEKYYLTKYLTRIPKILQHLYTMLMIVIGWVFFFSESAGSALKYLGMMVGIGSKGFLHSQDCFVIVSNWGLWLAGIICCTSIGSGILNRNGYEGNGKWFTDLAYMMLFVITISWLITDSFNPFLYFRF